MIERFTDTARAVVLLAKDSAEDHGQKEIGTGHMLLGIVNAAAAGDAPKAAAVITALEATPEAIRFQTIQGLERSTNTSPGHMAFTQNLKKSLEYALRSSMMLGHDHIGPEHLLAGLARATGSTAGKTLGRLGITDLAVHTAIQDTAIQDTVIDDDTTAPSPTAARTPVVYLPIGKSIFKNGGKVYPDPAAAQVAHPGQEIAPFAFPLHEGEFFDIGIISPRFSSWGKFASYPDAFAAEEFSTVQGSDVKIRIMVPDVQELRGKDSHGRDVVLGRSVEYSRISVMSRLASTVG